MNQSAPIGIFDSGIGGLHLAHRVRELLPNENIIYFGDTAHLPYGDKSAKTIQGYALTICDLLLKQGCKLILIACNSATAAAYDVICQHVGDQAIVLNVVDPVVEYVNQYYADQRVGLIGTQQTVLSQAYPKRFHALKSGVKLTSLATPLLVPMIESGFCGNQASENIIQDYLQQPELKDIYALILGCTHYPLIEGQIAALYPGKIEIIPSAIIVAEAVKKALNERNLVHKGVADRLDVYVSDYTDCFEKTAQFFFGEPVHLVLYKK